MGLSQKQRNLFFISVFYFMSSFIFYSKISSAEPSTEKTHAVQPGTSEKDTPFWKEGLITGGNSSVNQAIIKSIRYSTHPHSERMVIELSSTRNGELSPIAQLPLYQFLIDPKLNRLSLTLWGSPKLHFDPKKLHEMTRKSALLSRVQLLPKLEEELWTFGLNMKKPVEIRVFELDSPMRIIIDIKSIKAS